MLLYSKLLLSQAQKEGREQEFVLLPDLHQILKEYPSADLNNYRTHTGVFEVTFPKNAIFGATEGISKAVGDGYYVITEPLAKGTYTIQYKSSLICPGTECLQPNFVQDVKYTIIVQ